MTIPQRRAEDHLPTDSNFHACPRYDKHELSDEQIEQIATSAAKKAVELATSDFYRTIGKGLTEKLVWFVGVVAVATSIWMTGKGWIK
jgi:hypothetical protein